jgi:hypothetical protein
MAIGSSSNNNRNKAIRRAAWKMAKPMVKVGKRPGKTAVYVSKKGRRHLAIVKSNTKPEPKALPPKKKRS